MRWNLKEGGGKTLVRGTRITYQAGNGDERAKQREVIRGCGIQLLHVNVADIWGERDMTLSREILRGSNPSNNESQEVSRRRSSEEVAVMAME